MIGISRSDESRFLDEIVKEAIAFPNQKALEKYLKEHPDADKSKHKVVKTKEKQQKEDVKSESSSSYPSKIKYGPESWGHQYAPKNVKKIFENSKTLVDKAKKDLNSVSYKQLYNSWASLGSFQLALDDMENLSKEQKEKLSLDSEKQRLVLDSLMKEFPVNRTHL